MAENQQNHERAAETCEATDMEQDNGDNTGGEEASGDQTGASENKSDGTKGNQQTQGSFSKHIEFLLNFNSC